MKIFILFVILATIIFPSINCDEEDFRFELLNPRGFRHSFRPGFTAHNITLHGIVNEKNTRHVIGEYNGKSDQNSDGWFVYRNTKIPVNPGDTIYFWAGIYLPQLSRATAIRRYTVPDDAPRVSC